MYSNLIPFNFCAHALRFKLWGQMRYIPQPGFVCKSFCRPLSHKVSLSWLPCSAADKQMGEQRREGAGWGGGGYSNEMLTDPATITNHQSDLISWLAEWVGGLVHIRPTLPSCRACFSINDSLHTQPNRWSSTVDELLWGGDVSAPTRFETKVKAVQKCYLQLWINPHM